MAGFKTHITTSTALGIGYGTVANLGYGVPLEHCLLAGALCSVSGMLPDLDSDRGIPLRESLAFGAAVVPMLLVDRFQHLGLKTDVIVLISAGIYLAIRFGLGAMLRTYTRHRGMFHSIPTAIIFAELAFLICDCHEINVRLFKAAAVFLGVMSHLVLDEIYSIRVRGLRLQFKRSFGTALKLWDKVWWANVSAYAKLILLTYIVLNEPAWMASHRRPPDRPNFLQGPLQPDQPRAAKTYAPPRL